MKNRVIVSTIYILIGILICLIPTYLYPVCNGEMKMACYYTKQAEIGLGILITLLGIVFIAAKNENNWYFYPLAILLHLIIDAIVGTLSTMNVNAVLIEVILYVCAVAIVFIEYKIWCKFSHNNSQVDI